MTHDMVFHPIGVIRTPYREKSETPRQPGANGESVLARVILRPGKNFEQALKDIEGFERIWLLTWFDRSAHWKPQVLPPRSKKKHGVFATRSPHRPNPLGLTLCRLLEVKGRTLVVENPDLLDQTPVLDIKPYIPYADAFPSARCGWVEEEAGDRGRGYTVRVRRAAADQFAWLREHYGVDLEQRARTVLAGSPFPHPYRRIKAGPGRNMTLAVRSWRVIFRVEGTTVQIERVQSGYSSAAVAGGGKADLHDGIAHAAFHKKWSGQE
jgi:tRNA-Thr(GGU) m(6)t(6)A37 methyltransferase TsaA